MRSARGEFLSVMTVLAVPLSIAMVFPFEALHFRAADDEIFQSESSAAFVTLSREEEMAVIRATKSSWHGDISGFKRMHIDLSSSALLEDNRPEALSVAERTRPRALSPIASENSPFLPSLAAPPRGKMAPDAGAIELPFAKADMLKLK